MLGGPNDFETSSCKCIELRGIEEVWLALTGYWLRR
jgi:hypothetical protein